MNCSEVIDLKYYTMKTKILFLSIFLIFVDIISAKDLVGKVVDDAGVPIIYANVVLLQHSDSTLIQGTVTSEEGIFKLSSQKQQGLVDGILKITCVGYNEAIMKVPSSMTDLPTIVLSKGKVMLNEVTIVGRAQPIQMKGGTIVVNVANSVLSKEMDMIDMLRKIPGMTISKGQLTSFVGGEPIVYINNKKVRSMAEVKQLSVKDIKSVELNTNPGAQYDASTGAVLLIFTKKKLEGWAVQLEQELRLNHLFGNGEGAKVNYASKGLNVFGTFRYDDYRKKSHQVMHITSITPDTIWSQTLDLKSSGFTAKSYSYAGGIDYVINKNHSVGVKYDGTTEILNSLAPFVNTLFANSKLHTNIVGGSELYDKSFNNHFNAYYSGKLSEKLKLNFYADYAHSNMKREQLSDENSLEYGNTEVKSNNKSDYYLYAVSPTVEFALNKKHSFIAGSELSRVDGDSFLAYYGCAFNNVKTTTRENKVAGYLSYSYKYENLSLNAGIRYESVHSIFSDHFDSSNNLTRDYSNFFPSLGVTYKSGALSHSLNCRVSTVRPPFSRLNNDAYYSNRFQRQVGNPHLVPQISHNLQYSLMYKFLYFSLGYTFVKDYISSYMFSDANEPAIITNSWKNFDRQQNIKAVLNLQHRFGFYEPFVTGMFSKNMLKVETYKGVVAVDKPLLSFNINNNIHLPAKWLFNAEYEYNSRCSYGMYTFSPEHIVNLSIRKSCLNDALQISLSANDLFNYRINVYSASVSNIMFSQREDQGFRNVTFKAVYRFNNYKKEYKGKSASESELNRL